MKSKFTWIFTLLLAFFIQFAFAQERTVTGVVVDNQGMPIPSATVKVQGSSAPGVQTDFDGKYSIQAKPGDKVEISYMGMQTQIVTVSASGTVPNATLTDDPTLLEDVVVEAFRTTTRANSNVAVTTITSKTIEGRPNASFIQTLQGQIPGLNISTGSGQPGANSTVILRGYGSINGNVEPLYVIDGVPLNADNFRSINPNDIDAISVLKDAGATSIYGNRGANGVIIVKTKRGGFEAPLSVKYSGITSFTTMQGNEYRKMSSRQLLTLENQMGEGLGATMTPEEIAAYNINTDWYNELFRTGVSQNHVLSLSSGSKNLTSYTSFGFLDQEGILRETGLKRFNIRNNMSGKSSDNKFNYSTAFTMNYSRRNEATNLGTANVNLNPVIGANSGLPYVSPNWYTTGQDLHTWYETGENQFGQEFGEGTLALTPLMLLDMFQNFISQTDELRLMGNVTANYKLSDDFTLGTIMSSDYTQAVGLRVQRPEAFNSFLFQNPDEDYLGFQTESFAREFTFNMNTSLNYNHVFGEKHSVDASIFTEYYKAHLKSFSGVQNGLDPKLYEPGNGDGFIPHNPAENPAFYVPSVASGKATAGLFSYFGSVDYDYDRKYGFGASVRRDASYRFAGSNRWGTFWSLSGRWNIDQEKFMEGSKFDMLKLRASIGTAGNQNISGQSIFNVPNATRTLYNSGAAYNGLNGYFLSQYGNSSLRWETIKQTNIGLDFEVFQRRLRGNLDVYDKTTTDLFLSSRVSGVNGTFTLSANNGSLSNRGVEALVAYDVIRNNDFLLTLSFNGSYNKSEIIDIPEEDGEIDNGTQAFYEGGQYAEFYLTKYAGVNPANGNLLFYDSDGNLTENPSTNPGEGDDRRYTGKSPIPTYQGGFGFEANYKGFFLTTQFSFVADIYRLDYDLASISDPYSVGQFNVTSDLLDAWTPDNRNTYVPALDYDNTGADAGSDRWLRDASYVRLRYSSIGYSFNKGLLEKTPFTGIKAYFQAENLFTWTKWRGWDAESDRGSDQNQYPTPRILSIGLEVEF